jgi:uncharacterized protein (DUF2235 family)
VDKQTKRRRPTNVTKVARAILARDAAGIDQVVYYHDGVGTGGTTDKLTGGAFGHGIESNVRDLYRFILYNYTVGDELFFFGFSRGAFTVRTLAGFMAKVGLIQKDDDYFIPEVYECYESSESVGSDKWKHAFRRIKDTQPSPPIKFIGVWDTVGALGAPGVLGRVLNANKYKYHDIGLTPQTEHAYQALATDEQRKPFEPSVWTRPATWKGHLEQAWFAGVHSNVGGSYTPDGLANVALHWMVANAEKHGLACDGRFLRHYVPCFNAVLHNSMSGKYRLLGKHVRDVKGNIANGVQVHLSVGDRMRHADSKYMPKNVLEAFNGKIPPGGGGAPCV